MAGRFNWRDVAGTAKKWIDEKVTETVTTDRCEERAAEFRQHGGSDRVRFISFPRLPQRCDVVNINAQFWHRSHSPCS